MGVGDQECSTGYRVFDGIPFRERRSWTPSRSVVGYSLVYGGPWSGHSFSPGRTTIDSTCVGSTVGGTSDTVRGPTPGSED